MVRIAIVEDDAEYAGILVGYIQRYIKETKEIISFEQFSNGVNFIEDYRGRFDIVFMDIAMPYMNGLEAAKQLRENDGNICLIFITTFAKLAIRGYEVNALDFIVKPVTYELFRMRLDKAVDYCKRNMDSNIYLACSIGIRRVSYSDIGYVESDKHYIVYHVKSEELRTRGTMRLMWDKLIDRGFAPIRNSTLVNLTHVSRFHGNEVVVDGEVLPIARSAKKEFLRALALLMGKDI